MSSESSGWLELQTFIGEDNMKWNEGGTLLMYSLKVKVFPFKSRCLDYVACR
jgi:hypothetical protein